MWQTRVPGAVIISNRRDEHYNGFTQSLETGLNQLFKRLHDITVTMPVLPLQIAKTQREIEQYVHDAGEEMEAYFLAITE